MHYGIPTISTGAMFRAAIARGTDLGRIINNVRIDKGEYVPDSIVVAAINERTEEADCAEGFLLDGFPRTIPQAEALETILAARGQQLDGVLDFEVPMSELVQRFSWRRVCPVDNSTYHLVSQPPQQSGMCDQCHSQLITRPDDDPDVVQRRLEVYAEKTAPLIVHYREQGQLHTIDATAEPETVFGQVVGLLDGLIGLKRNTNDG